MQTARHQNLVLLLARDLAANLATAMFIVDPDGEVVFYNEPAERILGRKFADAGPIGPDVWAKAASPTTPDGKPVDVEALPLLVTMTAKQPIHGSLQLTGFDGERKHIDLTAFPLLAHEGDLAGAAAIFWTHGEH